MLMSIVLALYGAAVLKIYLDLFLVKARGSLPVVGWFLFFMWQWISEMCDLSANIVLTFTVLTVFLVAFTAYSGNLGKRCMFPAVYLAIWMLLEGAASFGVEILSGKAEIEFVTISIVSKLLLLLVVLGIREFARRMGIGREPYGSGFFFIIIPVAGMTLYNALYRILYKLYDSGGETSKWMLLAAISLILLNLLFYPFYLNVVRAYYTKKSASFYREQIELFKQERELEESAAAEIRELRHDMKQRLIYLDELIRAGKQEKALVSLEEMIGETVKQGELKVKTGNLVVDSLLNHSWKTASESGIIFHTEIDILPELDIKDTDLCVLMGNALDNAFEASGRVEEGRREVWVSLRYLKGCLLFQVKNCYAGELKLQEDGKIASQKKENGHGFGLYSMEKIVDKYHGRQNIKLDDGIFTANISICC